jgi:hypothetical protein
LRLVKKGRLPAFPDALGGSAGGALWDVFGGGVVRRYARSGDLHDSDVL